MKIRFLRLWDQIRTSYWFIPSLMTFGAVLLAFGATAFDTRLGSDWLEAVSWLQANQPEGARSLLSTVAGSMLGVAGVTFSITMVAMVMASSQFGPRLLSNFMRDRGNQTTLGIFLATFVYCLLVLRTVRSPGMAVEPGDASVFVPHLAILIAMVLAIVSLGAFIFFIHHAPESINVSNVIAKVGASFRDQVDRLHPERLGEDGGEPRPDEMRLGEFGRDAVPIEADGTGYIQAVDPEALLAVAVGQDLFLRVVYRPGDFVSPGKPLVYAAPADRVEASTHDRVRGAFAWGRARTRTMDLLYLPDQLVELAARALSPGVNDPRSAMACLDWLGVGLTELGRRRPPDPVRVDEQGRPRVLTRGVDFEAAMDAIFDPLRPYVSGDRNATGRAFKVLGEIASSVPDPDRRSCVRVHTDALLTAVRLQQSDPRDLDRATAMHETVVDICRGDVEPYELAAKLAWLGGSG